MTYNSAEAIKRFWSGRHIPASVRWIVVDNASSDESVSLAEAAGAEVIALPENVGFGSANNLGFEQAQSPYVGFINPDVRVDFGSLASLEEVIARTRGLVSPQLLNPDGSMQPNGRGYPFLAYKIFNRLDRSSGRTPYRRFAPEASEVDVVWLMGAVVLGKRETFMDLGPWDPRFFVYYEDSDLGIRAADRGISSQLTGRANWIHGWARETTKLAWAPWKRELPSMAKFYARYPYLLSPIPSLVEPWLRRRHVTAALSATKSSLNAS